MALFAPLQTRRGAGLAAKAAPISRRAGFARGPAAAVAPTAAREQQADNVAQAVAHAPEPRTADAARGLPPAIAERARPPGAPEGRPLGALEQSFMSRRFGRSFADVRVHTDGAADHAARALSARAFTVGRDITFARGEFAPHTPAGRRLLAHELTHVLQQSSGARIDRQAAAGAAPLSPHDAAQAELGGALAYLSQLEGTYAAVAGARARRVEDAELTSQFARLKSVVTRQDKQIFDKLAADPGSFRTLRHGLQGAIDALVRASAATTHRTVEEVRRQHHAEIPFALDQVRDEAFQITGIFEGGRTDSLQTVDAGIISYGRHQATLASGSLALVVARYTANATSATARSLATYMPRVQRRDATLAGDAAFLGLLRAAAREQEMSDAQDEVFGRQYWVPAVAAATADGVVSPLGLVMYYDTAIQGGLGAVRARTNAHFAGRQHTEADFLAQFNIERSSRLTTIATHQRADAATAAAAGHAAQARRLQTNAAMLDASARGRVGALSGLVGGGDLELRGDLDEQVRVGGRSISGVASVGQAVVSDLDRAAASPAGSQLQTSAIASALDRLGGLEMRHLLFTLADLRRREVLPRVEANLALAGAGVFLPRLRVAIEAVKLHGTRAGRWASFQRAVVSVLWPALHTSNPADEAALQAFLRR